jgi:hypothetical protein
VCRVSSSSLVARSVFCSPARPLGSLGFNSQSRRRPHRSPSSGPSLSPTHPCACFSSIGFRACSRLPSSRQTRHPQLDLHLTSLPQTSIEGRRRSCIPKKFRESGEDEASSMVFSKCSTRELNQNPCRVRR